MESLISLGMAAVIGVAAGKILGGTGQAATSCLLAVAGAAAAPTLGSLLSSHFDFSAMTPRLACAALAVMAFHALRRVAARPI
jgi:uncharacterized membrane protein YeaQ/YmgE (transglycosylase-associated protein family)